MVHLLCPGDTGISAIFGRPKASRHGKSDALSKLLGLGRSYYWLTQDYPVCFGKLPS